MTTMQAHDQKSKRVHVTIPPELHDVFTHLAVEDGVPLATKILQMAKSWVENQEDQIFAQIMEQRQTNKNASTALSHNELLDELDIAL